MLGFSKNLSSVLGVVGLVTLLVACGDGSTSKSSTSSSGSDSGTPTILVTAANGTSTQACAPIKLPRAIHRLDNANSVTSCAVFFFNFVLLFVPVDLLFVLLLLLFVL